MRYTHWFWDFDGTLYDTYPRAVRAFQKALRDKGIGISDDELLKRCKVTLRYAANSFDGEALGDDIMALFDRYAEDEGPDTIHLYQGAEHVLHRVERMGGKNYLYTHRDLSALAPLGRDGLTPLFCDMVTSADGFPHKPAPDALLYLVEKHGLDPADCVMVGDRDIDLDAGHAAGMDSVLFDPDDFYPDYPATHRFTDYRDMVRDLLTY